MLLKKTLYIENLLNSEWQLNIDRIHEITKKISDYKIWRTNNKFSITRWSDICGNMASVLYAWTGNTYIGAPKSEVIKSSFQMFFLQISSLIESIEDNEWVPNKEEKEFAINTNYKGILYRYIGSCDCNNTKIIYPIYSDVFVSWSKEEKSSYIQSKLYGPITWITCEVFDDLFSFDIENFQNYCNKYYCGNYNITCGNEREVVFPTIESCINSLRIIEYDDDGVEHIKVAR